MNIHVVLLGVVLAAFIGLWSNDQPATIQVKIPPVEQHQYVPTGPLSGKPTPLHFTSNNQSDIELKLPNGIAPGRYIAVNQLGEVKSINVDVVQPGESTAKAKNFYESEGEHRWFFVRIDEDAVKKLEQTAVAPDGPVLK